MAKKTAKDSRLGHPHTDSKDPAWSRRGKDKAKETVKDSRLGQQYTNSKDLVRNQRGTDISIGQGNSRLGHMEKEAHTSDTDRTLTSGAYKKVDKKVRPVPTTLPEEFRIVRRAHPNPLEHKPVLPVHPPDFEPSGRFTQERYEALEVDPKGFLWPEERKLAYEFIRLHENCFAWEEVRRGYSTKNISTRFSYRPSSTFRGYTRTYQLHRDTTRRSLRS